MTGEPGIGKSALLAEIAAAAQRLDLLVLEGRAVEGDQPFALAVDALDGHFASLHPSGPALRSLVKTWAASGRSHSCSMTCSGPTTPRGSSC